jgi:microcystin-dependent protein
MFDMAEPFLGSIALFPYNFAPFKWAFCAGQVMSISQNTALFSLLGTMYGGNGVTTFALPDLRGTVPISAGQGPGLSDYAQGEFTGSETVTLSYNENGVHSHTMNCTTAQATISSSSGNQLATAQSGGGHTGFTNAQIYSTNPPSGQIGNSNSISFAGGSQAHNNIQPYQTLNYCIALSGIFPQRP